ncbi:MAG: hypothetical protein JXR97_01375 [Planctomycetes bacterium]|nr:hypothetical protein [Planctomycetota bacterium]
MKLEKYSMGIGDRFGKEGLAQLSAMIRANAEGKLIVPVWNKSNREHSIIHTQPKDARVEADSAVKQGEWSAPYHVDADHINLSNVDGFIECSDFFTLDVAETIGAEPSAEALDAFIAKAGKYAGSLTIDGIDAKLEITDGAIREIGMKFISPIKTAGEIYRHVLASKGEGNFITEVSVDESDQPQTPVEMLFILMLIADEGIPAQTIAPKFTGRFNKGVDYVGDVAKFEQEFREDIAVIRFAIKEFGLPENLKLSVHSGSDKFSIYKAINKAITDFDTGLHLKTAGTTWLEELIGLAEADGEGLAIAKEIYAKAFGRFDELCKPYATVIDIDPGKLPSPEVVNGWTPAQYANALRHDQTCAEYNPHVRQLLHVGYKVAAELGERYLNALDACAESVHRNVTENIYARHLRPVFFGA